MAKDSNAPSSASEAIGATSVESSVPPPAPPPPPTGNSTARAPGSVKYIIPRFIPHQPPLRNCLSMPNMGTPMAAAPPPNLPKARKAANAAKKATTGTPKLMATAAPVVKKLPAENPFADPVPGVSPERGSFLRKGDSVKRMSKTASTMSVTNTNGQKAPWNTSFSSRTPSRVSAVASPAVPLTRGSSTKRIRSSSTSPLKGDPGASPPKLSDRSMARGMSMNALGPNQKENLRSQPTVSTSKITASASNKVLTNQSPARLTTSKTTHSFRGQQGVNSSTFTPTVSKRMSEQRHLKTKRNSAAGMGGVLESTRRPKVADNSNAIGAKKLSEESGQMIGFGAALASELPKEASVNTATDEATILPNKQAKKSKLAKVNNLFGGFGHKLTGSVTASTTAVDLTIMHSEIGTPNESIDGQQNAPAKSHAQRFAAGLKNTITRNSTIFKSSTTNLADKEKMAQQSDTKLNYKTDVNSKLFPEGDLREVWTVPASDGQFWAGRLMGRRTQYQNEPEWFDKMRAFAVSQSAKGQGNDEKAETASKEFEANWSSYEFQFTYTSFQELTGWCRTDAARMSLWEYQQAYARDTNEKGYLPVGGSMTDKAPSMFERAQAAAARTFGRHRGENVPPMRRVSGIPAPSQALGTASPRAYTPTPAWNLN